MCENCEMTSPGCAVRLNENRDCVKCGKPFTLEKAQMLQKRKLEFEMMRGPSFGYDFGSRASDEFERTVESKIDWLDVISLFLSLSLTIAIYIYLSS